MWRHSESPAARPHRGNAFIADLQVMAAFAATANDRDIRCAGINGILDQLGDGLQRIRLRQGDDLDCIFLSKF